MTPLTASLTSGQIRDILVQLYPEPDALVLEKLGIYLSLLLRWNSRTSLTAIREPERIVERHFGESLFLARHLPAVAETLLDLGSGAGFPGIPVQLACPGLRVTLAESQGKKAAFLRTAVQELGLSTEVWGRRAEEIPADRRFDVVALRAVDRPEAALKLAQHLLKPGGLLAHLTIMDGIPGLFLQGGGDSDRFLPFPTGKIVPRGTI